jgi:large subunit ribosomal protein L27e
VCQTYSLKSGKVVIVLQGKYAGRKAVIVKVWEEGNEKRPYPHALIAGVDKAPLPVTRSMPKSKIAKRIRVRPFVKLVNFNHILPTRYNLENIDFKGIVDEQSLNKEKKRSAKNKLKNLLQERYNSGSNKWFFSKLRF